MKPSGPLFDREWRLACEVKQVNRRKVDKMIRSHYIGQWPTSIVMTMGLFKGPKVLGVITYSTVRRSLVERFGQNTWELSRLWIDDCVPKNAETFVIGRSIRLIKRQHSSLETLISFADPEAGHSGTIYKASNWSQEEHESKNLFSYQLK
jgi:hypothetical protein